MNNQLYGNLIFELSHEGRKGYSLPTNRFGRQYDIPKELCRKDDARLPECDELTVVRHYTNLSLNNFGVDNGFYPLGSCTMKYNPKINEEMAALPQFAALHPLQPAETTRGAEAVCTLLCKALCGWSFGEASALNGVARCPYPMLFIHGGSDTFVPTRMVRELYGAKPEPKALWVAPGSGHAASYRDHKEEYARRVREFLAR